jgi:Protein of unknown function (DUF3592)
MSPRAVGNEKLPPGLLRATPRAVRLSAAGLVLTGLATLLFLGALIGGVWLYLLATQEARSAEAEVVEVTHSRKEPRLVVRYDFMVDGQTFSGKGRMGERRGRSLAVGSRIPIRYSPSDPLRNWIGRDDQGPVPIWVSPLLGMNLALGTAILAFVLRREAVLLREGRAAPGRVVDSKRINKGGGHGAKTAYRLTVEFRLLSGALQTGRFDRRKEVPVGASVVVVYDRDNPRRSELYPFRLVRLSD